MVGRQITLPFEVHHNPVEDDDFYPKEIMWQEMLLNLHSNDKMLKHMTDIHA